MNVGVSVLKTVDLLQLGGDKMKKLFKWWMKDHCRPIVVTTVGIMFFLICSFIHIRLFGTKDLWMLLGYFACALTCSLSIDTYYPMIIKHFTPPKKILLWWTSFYSVRIVSIIFTLLLFLIGYFGLFTYDKDWPIQTHIFYSSICAMSGGFIFAFIYYFIANTVSKSKSESNENADIKKADKPKYVTAAWWKYNHCFRIIGAIGIFSSILMYFILMFEWSKANNIALSLLIILENFSIMVIFSIYIGVLLAFVYWVIASIISWIYKKIKRINQTHQTQS